ncbi:MAG: hypothetical protein ABI551_08620 [Polyangiaceae bacterium]
MEYQISRFGQHVVVRWHETPTRASVEALYLEVDAAFKAAGEPLVCFVVISTDNADLPGAEARHAFQKIQRAIYDRSASIEFVLIGSSIRTGLVRTMLRAMSLVTRVGDRVRIHAGPEEALKGRNLPIEVAAALRGTPLS